VFNKKKLFFLKAKNFLKFFASSSNKEKALLFQQKTKILF